MTAPRVLVTGGLGFVGTAIVRALTQQHPEWRVIIVDIRPRSAYRPSRSDIAYIQADLTIPEEALRAVKEAQPSVIIHNAGFVPKVNARYSRDGHERVFKINVEGTRIMLDAAKEHGVRAFVLTSSCTIITDDLEHDHPNMTEDLPTDVASLSYGQSKAVAEDLVLSVNNPPHFLTTALRPSVILGPGDDNLIPTIHACIAKGETPFIVGEGTNLYDFTYVTNVADAHVLAVENLLSSGTAAGETFFISNMEPIPFRAFMLAAWKEFGHIPPFQVRIPRPVAWFAGLMAEAWTWATSTSATLSRGSVKDACQISYADGSKARRILGYKPKVSLVEGVRLACDEYKERLRREGKPLDNRLRLNWSKASPNGSTMSLNGPSIRCNGLYASANGSTTCADSPSVKSNGSTSSSNRSALKPNGSMLRIGNGSTISSSGSTRSSSDSARSSSDSTRSANGSTSSSVSSTMNGSTLKVAANGWTRSPNALNGSSTGLNGSTVSINGHITHAAKEQYPEKGDSDTAACFPRILETSVLGD